MRACAPGEPPRSGHAHPGLGQPRPGGLAPRRAGPRVRGPRVGWAPPPLPGQCPAECSGLGTNRLEGRAAEGVPTPASLRPPGSKLLVPPWGPKTAGAAAPVAAAACSWRARAAAAAAAASSMSTAGCLGLPRHEFWALAWSPWQPPRREPQQLQRPGPISLDPRSQDSGTRRFLLRRKIRHDLRPPPPNPPVFSRLTAQLRRREDAPA
ncbi:atherin-like [Pan troglodytes]|uniref:atherin-like n=1 Tax=Pan troglodytes TaxID=9598 RepID=UPI0030139AC7